MPKSKNRRKAHNPNKRARSFFDRTTLWTWEGLRDVNEVQIPTQGQLRTARGIEYLRPDIIKRVMIEPSNRWFLAVRAYCMATDGKPWVSYEFEEINGRLHGTGFRYWELRDKVLTKQRKDHVYDLGWIAQIFTGLSPAKDEERLDAIMQFRLGFMTDYRRDMWRRVNQDVTEQREAA